MCVCRALAGQYVEVGVTPAGDVLATTIPEPKKGAGEPAPATQGPRSSSLQLQGVAAGVSDKWVVGEDEFAAGVVGSKSLNLAKLRGKLPDW